MNENRTLKYQLEMLGKAKAELEKAKIAKDSHWITTCLTNIRRYEDAIDAFKNTPKKEGN